jgi:hypothetical protein
MKIITNVNQFKIIKPVSSPNISTTSDVQTNDGHLFYKTDNSNIHTTDKHYKQS